jgi:release factor glutamine methyltransferase
VAPGCWEHSLTIGYPDLFEGIVVDYGVYVPQHDSRLLADALTATGLATGRHVLDLCTGSGVLAIAAARLGAASVTAIDICPRAVRCSLGNAQAAGVDVDVRLGSLARAAASGPYDVVISNPPYVPVAPAACAEVMWGRVAPTRAWNAGEDGRLVLDPLCDAAPRLLVHGGTMLIVQSEFSGVAQSLTSLQAAGLDAEIIATQWVPFGPVLSHAPDGWKASGGYLTGAGRRNSW